MIVIIARIRMITSIVWLNVIKYRINDINTNDETIISVKPKLTTFNFQILHFPIEDNMIQAFVLLLSII